MDIIKDYVDELNEELCGAESYCEEYLWYKINGNEQRANQYKTMSKQELEHAEMIHSFAQEDISKFENIITFSKDDINEWEKAHLSYVEKHSHLKQMLK